MARDINTRLRAFMELAIASTTVGAKMTKARSVVVEKPVKKAVTVKPRRMKNAVRKLGNDQNKAIEPLGSQHLPRGKEHSWYSLKGYAKTILNDGRKSFELTNGDRFGVHKLKSKTGKHRVITERFGKTKVFEVPPEQITALLQTSKKSAKPEGF